MNFLLTIGISFIVGVLGAFGVYNYVPLDLLEFNPETKLGASITVINGGDTISSSRTVINDNFSNLNSGKIENSTSSVNSILRLENLAYTAATRTATIVEGRWTGNAIQMAAGGLGTTTMSQYRILLGNGTSSTTIATSTGSAGQLFTSNGAGAFPSWQSASFDTTANYNLSGQWRFDTTLNASSTLLVNSRLSVATSSPSQLVNLAVNGGALISATTTVGGLVATSSINASQFSSTATSTFAGGIQLSSGCFRDSVGCVNMKYFAIASTTGAKAVTQTLTIPTNFLPTIITGNAHFDTVTNSDVFCSFTWAVGSQIHLSVDNGGSGGSYSDATNICRSNAATDKMTLAISNVTATAFDLVYTNTGGSIGALEVYAAVIGN